MRLLGQVPLRCPMVNGTDFAVGADFVEHRMGLRMHRICAKPLELEKASRAVR